MLFPCDWCKQIKVTEEEWFNEKEPVCSDCKSKTNFGKKSGMIKGKIVDLTAQEKKEISRGLILIHHFVGTVRRIKASELSGKFKVYHYAVGWLMFLVYFLIPIIFKTDRLDNDYMFLLYSIIYGVVALFLHSKLGFILKYLQTRDIAKKCGFRGI